MNLPSLPKTERTYRTNLWPHPIKYRAFTTGQQSLMLQIANPDTPHQERVDTLAQVFDQCVDAGVPFARLPIGLVEKIFILMRCISIGEVVKISYKCNHEHAETEGGICGQTLTASIPLDTVDCVAKEGFKDVFDLPGDYHLKMRLPSYSEIMKLQSPTISLPIAIATFIDCLYNDDGGVWKVEDPDAPGLSAEERVQRQQEFDDLVAWVGSEVEGDVVNKINNDFFAKIPRIHYEGKINCPKCKHVHKVEFNSIDQLFI